MKSKRINWLDFAKGFTILFVVFDHTLGMHTHYAYGISNIMLRVCIKYIETFIMPVFFAISGMLYKPTNSINKFKILLYKKCGSFIIPYISFTFILMLIFHTKHFMSFLFSTYVVNMILMPGNYLWFLYALFFIFIIVGIMDLFHISLFNEMIISLFLLVIASYSPNFAPIPTICGYLSIFLMGRFIKEFNITKYLKNIRLIPLFIMWTIITLSQFIVIKKLHFARPFGNSDLVTFIDFNPKILSVLVFLGVFLNWNKNSYIFTYFTKYGKDTLLIYLVHSPIAFGLVNLIKDTYFFNTHYIICMIIIFVFTWYISIFICHLIKSFRIINFIFYPRKYMDNWKIVKKYVL